MRNIFGLSERSQKWNTEHNAILRYGEKTSNENFICRNCRNTFMPKDSNASYKTLFCSAKCEK